MAKKNCEVCGSILFSINNVCSDCKSWGRFLKSLHYLGMGPVTIADHLYESLVYKLENNESYYENLHYQEFDDELLQAITPFTFWKTMRIDEVSEHENH